VGLACGDRDPGTQVLDGQLDQISIGLQGVPGDLLAKDIDLIEKIDRMICEHFNGPCIKP